MMISDTEKNKVKVGIGIARVGNFEYSDQAKLHREIDAW